MVTSDTAPVAGANRLLCVRDAAAILGVCERTLFALRKNGDIHAVPIRGRVLYDPRDLAAYIERCKSAGAAASGKNSVEGGGR